MTTTIRRGRRRKTKTKVELHNTLITILYLHFHPLRIPTTPPPPHPILPDSCSSGSSSLHLSVAPAATSPSSPVRLHVYRINDGLGFYHTGVVFGRQEYTFCQDAGICRHKPGEVSFATFLGSVRLGSTAADRRQFQEILKGTIRQK